PDHDFDLIVLSVPHHRLADAAAFLAPRVGQATVLVFGNLWTEPTAAIGPLPLARIAWGFPPSRWRFRRGRRAPRRAAALGCLRHPRPAPDRPGAGRAPGVSRSRAPNQGAARLPWLAVGPFRVGCPPV